MYASKPRSDFPHRLFGGESCAFPFQKAIGDPSGLTNTPQGAKARGSGTRNPYEEGADTSFPEGEGLGEEFHRRRPPLFPEARGSGTRNPYEE